ncbi:MULTISPECIES: glutamyl-tRNA amidotransferase [Paenibacillaceae]|uniref:Glutamyl-tRNA amidotransferase n=2 Tax=Paenibacillaceae TaxID=186822 RepID=A0ABW1IUX2_9BACL|nr:MULTISPECIES: glutamyl-tRNA amidotransferase [Paenibacillus]MED4599732.1 glutamyl-tRNA amidotransferase [Paenibacillus validus]MED4604835.1 glutamyl-tRNA amidotransferase [Paenibacillus validus]NTZ19099.1 glutamyl-tRNA amidotransferase [Paenibacillus sp. JMULE4]
MMTVLFGTMLVSTAYAQSDPMTTVNNLSNFIFGLIRAVGMIILGFGVVQIGLSLKSHDPSQRANGFLTLAGGVIITFTKEILDLITG